MSNAAIYQAMVDKIKAANLGMPIAYADVKYDPPPEVVEWLQIVFLPAESNNRAAANNAAPDFSGIFNLNYVQRPDRGAPRALTRTDEIAALFVRGDQLGPVCIDGSPSLISPFQNDDTSIYPVRVRYLGNLGD